MSDTKFSNMMIMLLVLGLIMTGLGLFITGLAVNYGVDDSEYENISSVFISEQNETQYRLEIAKDRVTNVQEDKTLLDRLTSFFRAGYDTAVVLLDSFSSFNRLINASLRNIPFLGSIGAVLTGVLGGIILIIIIVRLFLHFLIKSDRL